MPKGATDKRDPRRDERTAATPAGEGPGAASLTDRQRQVLRAVVAGYLGDSGPVGSNTVSHLLPVRLSSASIRNTMAELTGLGLLDKPHASAGRVPTETGLRHFLHKLLEPGEVGAWARREIDHGIDALRDLAPDSAFHRASDLIAEHTGQLGFVLVPRLEEVVVRHVSLVRLASERLMAVLVSETGQAYERVVEDAGFGDQAELDRAAALLNERLAGLTLSQMRERLARDLDSLRSEASRLALRALELGRRVVDADPADENDLVIATRLAVLDQPELRDPARLRELISALETRERLVDVLDRLVVDGGDLVVALGEELEGSGLGRFAVVAASGIGGRGALGVIGPSRMDYARIIPLVSYCSRRVVERLNA